MASTRPNHSPEEQPDQLDLRNDHVRNRPPTTNGVYYPQTSEILSSFLRHKLLILGGILLGLLVGLLVATLQPTTYQAESRVFLSSQSGFDPLSDGQFGSDPSRYLDQQAALMTSSPLLVKAIAMGGQADSVKEYQKSLEVVTSSDSDVLTVRATGSSSAEATSRVDSTVAAYRDYQKTQVAERLSAIDKLSTKEEQRAAEQRAVAFGDGVELVEEASATARSSAIRNASVLSLVGLFTSLAIALIIESRPSRSGPTPTRRGMRTGRRSAPDPTDPRVAAQPRPSNSPRMPGHGTQRISKDEEVGAETDKAGSASRRNVLRTQSIASKNTCVTRDSR